MKFSILIAHFNNASFFKDCYNSLLNQTYKNWEAVILDDGSRNEEKEAVKKLIANDPRFRFYENDKNYGVGLTKAKLIELAKGEICGFVDPDDSLKPKAIETLIQNYNDPETVAVYSQFIVCNDQLQEKKIFPGSEQVRNGDPLFLNIFFELNHLFSFRREAYEKCDGIDTALSSSVDQDLYLKIYERGSVKFVKQPLYLYRQHKKGISQNADKKKKLYQNWDIVLRNSLKRRGLIEIYGTKTDSISNLPEFIFAKQNTFIKKIKRRLF